MSSPELHPVKYSEFNFGDGLIQDQFPILRREMLGGSADNPNNIVIFVGPAEEKFVVNKCLAMISSLRLEKAIVNAGVHMERIKFPEILPMDFQVILECAILGQNWTLTNLKETCRLIETAAQFGFYDFIETICETVLREAQTRIMCKDEESLAIILLQSFGFESLREIALECILENATSIFRGNQFLQLSLEDFGEILIQDKLKIESEIEVLNAVIRWGMNVLKNEKKPSSPENLRQVLALPLNWVRFPNVKEHEFQDYVIPLKILTDQQVNVMEQWYKNSGSIGAFNNQPRNYLKTTGSQAATNDSKCVEEFLHATQVENFLAKFNMSVQTHNLEIEFQNSTQQIHSQEIEARIAQVDELRSKNEELEEKVRWLESLLENSQLQIDNLEQQVHNLEDDLRLSDTQALNLTSRKVKLKKRVHILESVNRTFKTKIARLELQRVKCSETNEPLSWELFQKETASTVVELQNFSNTKTFACVIIIKNNTSVTLGNFQLKIHDFNHVHITLPSNIRSFCTHNFGQTGSLSTTLGVLSYDFGSTRIVVRHWFLNSHNDFGVAIAPLSLSINDWKGFNVFTQEDWTNDSTKVKALCKAPKEMEKCIQLGNVFLHAELIGTGPKAVLRVLLTA